MARRKAEPGRSPDRDPSQSAPGLLDQPLPVGPGATGPAQEEKSEVSHGRANLSKPTHASNGRKVRIGQRWRRKQRRRRGVPPPTAMIIYQVHPGDKTADMYPEGADPHVKGSLQSVKWSDLRAKYRLDKTDEGSKVD